MPPVTKRVVVAVGLALLLALAGCSGGSGGDARAEPTAEAEEAEMGADSTDSADRDARSADARSAGPQYRVRTGEATLRVDDLRATASNLTATARRFGGFVAGSDRQRHRQDDRTWLTGTLTLRVPVGNFSALHGHLPAVGTVVESATSSEDVTGEIVDREARLENLRAQRDRLQSLYDDASDTEAVLAVGERLSETQSEIERLEGELAALRDRAAYSTLTVELREPEPESEPADDEAADAAAWHETGVVAAFLDSVAGVATTLRLLVVAAAYLAPFAAVFGAPVAGVLLWRRRRDGGEATGEPAAVED